MPQSLAARPRAPLHSPHRRPAPPPGHARHDAASWPAPAYETKLAQLDLVSAVDDSGTFEGYASLFHREDLGRDVIVPGAFRASLAKRGAGGIRMLYQHDPAQPIGVWLAIGHIASALACFVTIVGIPFGIQHLKLALISLAPIGQMIVTNQEAESGRYIR